MSNLITIPFNFRPAGFTTGNASSSYSPTSGKYAIVTINMYAYTTSSDVNEDNVDMRFNPDSQTMSFQIYMTSSDTLAFTTTVANETVSTTGTSAGEGALGSDTSQVTCTINSNTIATVEAAGSATIKVDPSATKAETITISGGAGANFMAHEYNEIS